MTTLAIRTSCWADRKHTQPDIVRLLERARADSADAFTEAFPANLEKAARGIPGLHRTAISRARNGEDSSPGYRMKLFLLAAMKLTGPAGVWTLIADICLFASELTDEPEDEPCFVTDMAIDGEEDAQQVALAERPDCPERARRWLSAYRRQRAAGDALAVSVMRRMAAVQRGQS